jgi:hypothetical protein
LEQIVLQLLITGSGVILSVLGVLLILAKKLPGSKANGNGYQRQITNGASDTQLVTKKFEEQVNTCNGRWLEQANFSGRIEDYMTEIRSRLDRIEAK